MRDDMLPHRIFLGLDAVIHAVRSRMEGGVLGSEAEPRLEREEVMLPQPWGHTAVQQRLCDGRCVCVPRISQVVPRVPVSCRARARLSVRRTREEAIRKISLIAIRPCIYILKCVATSRHSMKPFSKSQSVDLFQSQFFSD